MISQIIRTLGWIGFAVAIGYFILSDKASVEDELNPPYIQHTRQIFMVSAGLIVAGYVLKFVSGIAGVGKSRCRKCGKRIPKSEMYCFDHRKETIWEAKERTRFTEGRTRPKS